MTAREVAERISKQQDWSIHSLGGIQTIVEATHVVECIEALEEFEKRHESDFFRVTSSAEDGRVLADWVSKVHRALALAKGETHAR